MLRVKSQNNLCEQEAKFVQDRISMVERHFAELCTIFAAYTRKAARLRDKNDEVAKIINAYAESENVNRSLSDGLVKFAETLSVVGDYRDAEVQRLDSKVTSPLSQYAAICKNAREDVRNTFSARDKELTRRRNLDRIRERNPRNRQMISQAESELMKASAEVSKVVKGLEDQIDSFEKRKLHDLRTVLMNFVTVELSFHTKAVELLTKAYQDVAEIDEMKDLEDFQLARGNANGDFRETLRGSDNVPRLDAVKKNSFRQAYSLTNLANRLNGSPLRNQRNNKIIESVDSEKTALTNSSESVQIEEYSDTSEETESDTIREKTVRTRHKTV